MTTRDADRDVARTTADSGDGLLSRVGSGSVVLGQTRAAGKRVANAVRASWLYRWLTAEPDPEVIVIDLRETWTVGPFLRILDWIIGFLIDAMEGSIFVGAAGAAMNRTRDTPLRVAGGLTLLMGLAVFLVAVAGDAVSTTLLVGALVVSVVGVVGLRDRRSWEELRDTRVVEFLIRALEPPAPPDETDESIESDDSVDSAEFADADDLGTSRERDTPENDVASELFPDESADQSSDAEPTLFSDDSETSSDETRSESTSDEDRS
ncbi:hypothetical protein [Halorubrum aethiopicum]|uniref:hypothetical protein n=1 Tax=Halorubrum aethiopicum TaxID=1758255 RepID=UPI0008365A44|nr:hypothetical protein [Halorubrum aethiopicum]